MYYEDIFHHNEDNDLTNNQKKELINIKLVDPGYGYIYRNKLSVTGKLKKAKIDCYTSGDSGTYIRNAETGELYKYKVGSKYEDLFFKTSLATGELKTRNSHNILFYDSPEQFEKHLMHEVDEEIKENWLNKKMLLLSNNSKLQ